MADGVIFDTQDDFILKFPFTGDVADLQSVKVKYRKPDYTEGFFDPARVSLDLVNKIVTYLPDVGDNLGIVNTWRFWLYFTTTEGRVRPSTVALLRVYKEGKPIE